MATFKYVGTQTKENGKVDIRVGSYSFNDVTPDVFNIVVPDGSREEVSMEQAQDPFDGTFLYIKQT